MFGPFFGGIYFLSKCALGQAPGRFLKNIFYIVVSNSNVFETWSASATIVDEREAERLKLIEREAAESANSDGRSRMLGGFRGGPFRGPSQSAKTVNIFIVSF